MAKNEEEEASQETSSLLEFDQEKKKTNTDTFDKQKTLIPQKREYDLLDILKLTSFGTPLRAAIEKISYMDTGALIVVANEEVLKIIRGGFSIDCKFTSNRLAELAKMDGAIILNNSMSRILYAGTLIAPDSSMKTIETGSRHQAAERAAKQTGQLCIAVSQRTGLITIYYGNIRYQLKKLEDLLSRIRSTLNNMTKYRKMVDDLILKLNVLEIVGVVEVYDVILLMQRLEIISRISEDAIQELTEIGKEAGLFDMEFKELTKDLEKELLLIIRDYKNKVSAKAIRKYLSNFSFDSLLELNNIARSMGYDSLHEKVVPKGYRFLSKIKSLSPQKIEIITKKFRLKELFDLDVDQFSEILGLDKKECLEVLEEVRKVRNELISKL